MGEKIENGTIQIGEIIGKTLDGRDIFKFTELGMAENVKIREPQYKDGDFVVDMRGRILIFKNKVGDKIYGHAYFADGLFIIISARTQTPIERFATEEEKQKMLNALAKEGKMWNEEKKCIEDIPKCKFNVGDKVVLKSGYKKSDGITYLDVFDLFIGKPLTIRGYTDIGNVYFSDCQYIFEEDWLEPYEELKKGDLAIFWDHDPSDNVVRFYRENKGEGVRFPHVDSSGFAWRNAVKFESKAQFEKLIKGRL